MPKVVSKLMKPTFHNAIVVLLILYILFDTDVPHEIKVFVNEPLVKVVALTGCLYLTLKRPVLGCLSLIVLYELLTKKNDLINARQGISIEEEKERIMEHVAENNTKVTLEEEIVQNLIPYYNDMEEETQVEPVLTNQISSSDL